MKRVLWWSLLGLFFSFTIWVFFFSVFTQISELEVKGEVSSEEKEKVKIVLRQLMEEKKFYYFPKSNLFLFSSNEGEKVIRNGFPLIKKVFWRKIFPNRLELSLEDYQGVFIWCFEEECYWVDKDGFLFWGPQNFQEAEKTGYFIIREQINGHSRKVGENILSSQIAISILDLIKTLKSGEYWGEQEGYFSPDIASKELRVKFVDGWTAFFDLNGNLDLQIKTLQEVLEEKLKDIPRNEIDYIDLRFSGKAIFKLKH